MCDCISEEDYVCHCVGSWVDCQLPHIHSLSRSILSCPGMLSIDVINAKCLEQCGRKRVYFILNHTVHHNVESRQEPAPENWTGSHKGTLLIIFVVLQHAFVHKPGKHGHSFQAWAIIPQLLIRKTFHSLASRAIWCRHFYQVSYLFPKERT